MPRTVQSVTRQQPVAVSVRAGSGDDHPRLVEIWRSAVDATHDFLSDEHRDEIQSHLVGDYFPAVALLVADVEGRAVGFAGVAGQSLEMLFVHDDWRGRGVGSALLAAVIEQHDVTGVEVNEQNPDALAFYRSRGFDVRGRSELDGQGWPYPILRLQR